jgi:hypothetical protein
MSDTYRIEVAHQLLTDRLTVVIAEDHDAALIEDRARRDAGDLRRAAMRGEINRMIERERFAAQIAAVRPKDRQVLAHRAEVAWRAMYPALAEFRDYPTVGGAS